ncbi:unnamed protein product [Phytophthora fragariaefolia]|uniref:Unnamed protein product n=1 Tax=Phytophthora fragariaefolia TaxID=1490495 RepID=A0A9W6XIP1_9STRA|nr:unnamed protein product [Phytophthora fragariaefolia]
MLADSGLPHRLWEYAIQHATFIRSRILVAALKIPHLHIWQRPDVSNIPIFSQAVVDCVSDKLRRKKKRFLNTREQLVAFIGCAEDIKGFCVYMQGTSRLTVVDQMLFEVDPDAEDVVDALDDDGEDESDSDTEHDLEEHEDAYPS